MLCSLTQITVCAKQTKRKSVVRLQRMRCVAVPHVDTFTPAALPLHCIAVMCSAVRRRAVPYGAASGVNERTVVQLAVVHFQSTRD